MNSPRLSIIPARAATDPGLKPRDLQVLCVLGRHTNDHGWCRRSKVKMAAEMGCGRTTVHDAITRLIRSGYLEQHVQESSNGRDSAHIYRVVLDPVHPDLGAVSAPNDEVDVCETSSELTCRQGDTPVGIPTPPVGPGPTPPVGSGPTPMLTTPLNDPSLTKRESAGAGASADAPDGAEGETVSRDTWRRRFRKAHSAWPTFISDSVDTAEAAWFDLSEDDRGKAADMAPAYERHCKAHGRTKFCAFAVYLRDKRWERLPEQTAGKGASGGELAPPFGKLWAAERFADLTEPAYGRMPKPTAFIQKLLDAGGETGRREELARLAKYGWPKASEMDRGADRGRGFAVPAEREPLAALCVKVHAGSTLWDAWAAEHRARGWPWLGDLRPPEWVWLPGCDGPPPDTDKTAAQAYVRAAMERFEAVKAAATTEKKEAAE